jgi:hypothetical protein
MVRVQHFNPERFAERGDGRTCALRFFPVALRPA